MATNDYDILFKVLAIGDSGVGKTSLLCRFVENTFSGSHVTTAGVDFVTRTVKVDGNRIKLQIWNTAGQEKHTTISPSYYRGTHGVLIVYDVSSLQSFANVNQWLSDVDKHCDSTVSRILVGNKQDDAGAKVVSTEEAQRLADQQQIQLFESSAKVNENIEEVFVALTKNMLDRVREQIAAQQSDDSGNASTGIVGNKQFKKTMMCCSFLILFFLFLI